MIHQRRFATSLYRPPPITEIYSHEQAADWLAGAPIGECCCYHVGRLSDARARDPITDRLAEYMLMLAEIGCARLSQTLIAMGARMYVCVRAPRRPPPVAVDPAIEPRTLRAVRLIWMRPEHMSAARYLSRSMGVTEPEADRLLRLGVRAGLIQHDHLGARLTKEGRNVVGSP